MARINGNDIQGTLGRLEMVWKQRIPERPFTYHFLDEDYNKLYVGEQRSSALFTVAATLAILLACLGLFGLAAFTTVQRTKEIGIRKIVGASFFNIASILSRDFTKWIIASILIGSTLSWYLMNQWLQNFAYRTHLDWWIFLIAGICVILIACITVSWHIYRAANRNPVETLRYE